MKYQEHLDSFKILIWLRIKWQHEQLMFRIINVELYVPITLFINDNIKFLEKTKQGFKTTIFWNKYRSGITTKTKKKQQKSWLSDYSKILIDCLLFYWKMVMMILWEILLINITWH